MTHHMRNTGRKPAELPDMEETRDHIFAAGRELLLAADGALRFCKDYVETSVPESSRPQLVKFFRKALFVADDLAKGLSGVSTIKRTAEGVAKPIFEAMSREMKCECADVRHARRPKAPAPKQRAKRPAAKKSARKRRA